MLDTLVRQRPVPIKSDQPDQKSMHTEFKGLRYGLEGALLCVALVGILTWARGYKVESNVLDFAAALMGFAGVLVVRFFFLKTK